MVRWNWNCAGVVSKVSSRQPVNACAWNHAMAALTEATTAGDGSGIDIR